MKTLAHIPYDPAAVLITEEVKVGLPLRTKMAFVEVARSRGVAMSVLLRAAVDAEIVRAALPRTTPKAGR